MKLERQKVGKATTIIAEPTMLCSPTKGMIVDTLNWTDLSSFHRRMQLLLSIEGRAEGGEYEISYPITITRRATMKK